MARTLGAKNKTPRELRTDAKNLTDKAKYIEKLKKAQEKKK
jgi:hypothetical protein